MSTSQTITFTNSMPADTTLVTFELLGLSAPPPVTVSSGASVVYDVGTLAAPWTVIANVADTSGTPPSYYTAPVMVGAAQASVNILPVGALAINGGVPPPASAAGLGQPGALSPLAPSGRGHSIFDPIGVGASAQLAFTMQAQSQTQWCWCTVAACVGNYYGAATPWTQCGLASWKFPSCGDCCNSPLPNGCNSPSSVMDALTHVGHLQAGSMGGLSFADIKAQIDHNHPIGVNVQWTGTTLLHSIAITGYNDAGQTLTVQDPSGGSTTVIAFASFPASYSGGASWYSTYTTKS
jgi:hypothetical protein